MSELQDLTALIRANTALIVIETPDEGRVVDLFMHVLMNVWRPLFRWSITEGLRRVDLHGEDEPLSPPDATTTLRTIRAMDQRGIHLLLDFHPYLGYATTQRMVRELIDRRDCKDHTLVLVGAKIELPEDLEHLAVRFSLRLPDEKVLLKLVQDEAALYMREHGGKRVEVDQDALKMIVRNLRGLSMMEARRLARHLIFRDGVISSSDLPELAKLKFELLNKSGHLHFEYDTARFADVAGLTRLKAWVNQRRAAYTSESLPRRWRAASACRWCGWTSARCTTSSTAKPKRTCATRWPRPSRSRPACCGSTSLRRASPPRAAARTAACRAACWATS
jgi:hypothetical protein